MEVEKSSHVGSKRSCFTQTSCLGEDAAEDSQLEYLSAHEEYEDSKNSSSEFPEQREMGEGKDMPLLGDKVPPQVTAREEGSGKSEGHTRGVAVQPDSPVLSARERAPLGKQAESSDFSSCEEPAVCTRGTDSTAEAAETPFPVSESLPSKNPGAGVEAADESCGGSPSCVKSEHQEALKSVPSVSGVVQAVDASSDFGACFTTSTTSSAQVCLCSRAVNTETTMMSKTRPMGWLGQAFVDAASNTEGSFEAQSSHLQEQQESKDQLHICDCKMSTDRPEYLTKQTRKNCVSGCCENILQRATAAELQLLAVHYDMCYQHCWKVYELALEENTCFGRCDAETELYSSLLLVLDKLDNNYKKIRMEINMGIPLNALPPLSVELKFSPISSFYIPCKYFRRSLYSEQIHATAYSGSVSSDLIDLAGEGKADFGDPKLQEKEISLHMDKSQTDGDQPSGSASPDTWQEQPKDQERGCVKNEESTEYWFDAEEDSSVADFSVMRKKTKKQQEKQDTIDSGVEVKTQESGNGHSIPVGGPRPSVPECPDLKSPAQEVAHSLLADNQKDAGEISLQKTSISSFTHSSGVFISNLSSCSLTLAWIAPTLLTLSDNTWDYPTHFSPAMSLS